MSGARRPSSYSPEERENGTGQGIFLPVGALAAKGGLGNESTVFAIWTKVMPCFASCNVTAAWGKQQVSQYGTQLPVGGAHAKARSRRGDTIPSRANGQRYLAASTLLFRLQAAQQAPPPGHGWKNQQMPVLPPARPLFSQEAGLSAWLAPSVNRSPTIFGPTPSCHIPHVKKQKLHRSAGL